MNTATASDASAAYLMITGGTTKLTRQPRAEGTHAWIDPQGRRLVALWDSNSNLTGWRFDGTTFWLKDHAI